MNEITKTLGVLTEQGRWIMGEIHGLRKDVKDLQNFKWKVLGFSSCIAFLAAIIVEFVRK